MLSRRNPLILALLVVVGLIVSLSASLNAQIPQISIPDIPVKTGDLPFKLTGQDPISTSFGDADKGKALPDTFFPSSFQSLFSLPRGAQGGFLLQPGAYETEVESFCLHAGTHGPSSGDGYLYAPLKGSKAEIIHSILQGASLHRDIPQTEVQMLIWAIESRAKLQDLPPNLQLAAAKLLSKKELVALDGGALGLVPDAIWERALQTAPPEVRTLLQTQAAIRSKLADAKTTFADVEKIAVLSGPAEHDGMTVPRARWSAHPGGFFVRYLPNGYTKMTIQVYVPGGKTQGMGQSLNSATLMSVSLHAMEFDPTADVAVPADTSAQRLGLSDVPLSSGDDPKHGHWGQADGNDNKEGCKAAASECKSTLNCAKGSKVEVAKDCSCWNGSPPLAKTCQVFCKCTGGGPPVSSLDWSPANLDRNPATLFLAGEP